MTPWTNGPPPLVGAGYDGGMGTALAYLLKPITVIAFGLLIGGPAVRAVKRMRDGRLKRLLLRKMYDL